MASTYVNNLRLNEMATGDASGTWGTVTNTNLELIGEALGYNTQDCFSSDADATTTVADGATDPARALYFKVTSSATLSATRTLTIAPNTVSRVVFIENATTGSQSINISQGSGANVTIPTGDTKAVYLDGAGSGAAVVDAFASLSVVDLKVEDDLTVTDDLIVNGDIDLEGSIDVNGTANLDVVDIDGAVDMASTLQVDGAITSSAGATITVADNSDNLTLTSTDADANAGPNLRMYRNSGSPADNDYIGEIQFEGRNDNSQDVVYAGLAARILDASDGTEDGRFELFTVRAGSQISTMVTTATELIFNNDSIDFDFRVESNGNANMLFVDGGNDRVGIGTSSPRGVLDLGSGSGDGTLDNTPANYQLILEAAQSTTGDIGRNIAFVNSTQDVSAAINSVDGGANLTQDLMFAVANSGTLSEVMRLDATGNVGIGTTSASKKLVISDDGNQGIELSPAESGVSRLFSYNRDTSAYTTLQIQGADLRIGTGTSATERMRIDSSGNVGIGDTSPEAILHVSGVAPTYTNSATVFYGGTTNSGTENGISLWSSGDALSGGLSSNLLFANSATPSQTNTARSSGNIQFANITTASKTSEIKFGGYYKGTTSFVERMRIDGSGNVGIGNDSPSYLLDVKADADADTPLIRIRNEDTGSSAASRLYMTANGNNFSLYNYGDGTGNANETRFRSTAGSSFFTFAPSSSEKMRITSAGHVHIDCTATPSASVQGSSIQDYQMYSGVASTSTRKHKLFFNGNGEVGSISTSSSATAFNTSSDARLKDVIGEARGLEVINALNPVAYNWKADGKADEGLIAQEVLDIVPNAVSGSEEEYYQMDYSKLVTPLIKAIQEQQEQIEQLKAKIQTLQ